MKLNRIAAGALVAGGLALALYLAGCGSADPRTPPAAPRTTTPGTTPADAAPSGAAPSGTARGPLGTVRAGSVGQDIRYLGEDGRITNLDVPDFPR